MRNISLISNSKTRFKLASGTFLYKYCHKKNKINLFVLYQGMAGDSGGRGERGDVVCNNLLVLKSLLQCCFQTINAVYDSLNVGIASREMQGKLAQMERSE